MSKKLILCRGIQASGKSTFSKAWAAEDPKGRVRFCYDDLREMMGQYWVPSREHMLGSLRIAFLEEASLKSYDIIIDNMNLSQKEVDFYQAWVTQHPKYTLEFKDFFDTPLSECIQRDKGRPRPIGAAVITATYNRYRAILEASSGHEPASSPEDKQ